MKKLMILLFTLFVFAGCNGIPSSNSFKQPEGKVVLDNKSNVMMIGDFEWIEDDFEARKISSSDVVEQVEQFKTLQANKGEQITIEIDQSPPIINVKQINEDGSIEDIDIENQVFALPTVRGYYIYEVEARWKEGKSTFIFDVDVH